MPQRRRSMATRVRWTVVDAVLWCVALFVAASLRLDFHMPVDFERDLAIAAVVAGVLQAFIGWLSGPYAVNHELGSFEETGELARTTLVVGAVVSAGVMLLGLVEVPRQRARLRHGDGTDVDVRGSVRRQVAHHPSGPGRRGRSASRRLRRWRRRPLPRAEPCARPGQRNPRRGAPRRRLHQAAAGHLRRARARPPGRPGPRRRAARRRHPGDRRSQRVGRPGPRALRARL